MSRYTFISIGVVGILIMLLMWGYLFLYGAPEKPKEVFSNLGIFSSSNSNERTIETGTQIPEDATKLSLEGGPLQQVTGRAIAGFGFIENEPDIVLYAERGTGHIFEIDLASGFERQISLTTLPQTVRAVFSPDGHYVALTSYEGYKKKTTLGRFTPGEDTLMLTELRSDIDNIAFLKDGLGYTTYTKWGTMGYVRTLDSTEERILFEVPISDAKVTWGKETMIAPKPSALLESALYVLRSDGITPKTDAHLGLTGFVHDMFTLYTFLDGTSYHSLILTGGEPITQGIVMLPEKCAFDGAQSLLWCGSPLTTNSSYLEDWYKGIISSEDYLWRSDIRGGDSVLVEDFTKYAGKTLDVTELMINNTNSKLLFKNKTDNTLWLYKMN